MLGTQLLQQVWKTWGSVNTLKDKSLFIYKNMLHNHQGIKQSEIQLNEYDLTAATKL